MRTKRTGTLVLLFSVATFIFVFGLLFFVINKNFQKDAIKTNAVITSIERSYSDDDSYDVFVKFEVDGVTYEGKLNVYVTGMGVNQTVKIFYKKNNPNNFIYANNKMYLIVLVVTSIVGLGVYALFGYVAYSVYVISPRRLNKIKKNSSVVKAVITDYVVNYNTKLGNDNPATLICRDSERYMDEYKVKFITNGSFTFNCGDAINVYVDTFNSKNYFIDIYEYEQSKLCQSV